MEISKSYVILMALTICLSCQKKELGMRCNQSEIAPPMGYRLTKIGNTRNSEDILYFQFLNKETGFAVAKNNRIKGGQYLYKTMDGGSTWSKIDYDRKVGEGIITMEFKNQMIGILSIQDAMKCIEPDCVNPPTLRRTKNGGLTWENITAEDKIGELYQLQTDSVNFYGLLITGEESSIITSTNNGDSWQTIFSQEELKLDQKIIKFILSEKKFYLLTADNRLIIANSFGDIESTIKFEEDPVLDFQIINKDHFIISQLGQVSQSIDGGNSWNVIFNNHAKLGGFQSATNGFLVIEQEICQSEYYKFQDAFAITTDGGNNWLTPEINTTNLRSKLTHAQLNDYGDWILSIENNFYIMEKN